MNNYEIFSGSLMERSDWQEKGTWTLTKMPTRTSKLHIYATDFSMSETSMFF